MIGVSLPIFELSKHSMRCGRTRRVPNDVKMIIRNSLLDQKNKEGRARSLDGGWRLATTTRM